MLSLLERGKRIVGGLISSSIVTKDIIHRNAVIVREFAGNINTGDTSTRLITHKSNF